MAALHTVSREILLVKSWNIFHDWRLGDRVMSYWTKDGTSLLFQSAALPELLIPRLCRKAGLRTEGALRYRFVHVATKFRCLFLCKVKMSLGGF
jgi:hypothetical protein